MTLFFATVGLCDGLLTSWLFRWKYFYLYGIFGALIGYASASYYIWYASHYDEYGLIAHLGAYLSTGLMTALIMVLIPLLVLVISGWIPFMRSFAQTAGAVILAAALFIGVYGSVDGERNETVEHHDIYVENLPDGFDGFKLAQITDTHIGPYYKIKDLSDDLDKAKAEGAEVIMMTGDLIDDIRFMPETAGIISSRSGSFPYGMIYVRGNHEFHRDPQYIEEELKKTPIRILNNSHTAIARNNSVLFVAGVDYPEARGEERNKAMASMTEDAFRGIPEGAPRIFLAHHSDFIDAGFANHAFLTLTGHTHGMQTGVMGKPLFLPFKYTRGSYTDSIGYGYVSRGNGGWFPFRIGCSRELAIFTLHKKKGGE